MTKKEKRIEILPGLTMAAGLENLIDVDAIVERALARTGPMTLEDFAGSQVRYDNYLEGLRFIESFSNENKLPDELTELTPAIQRILEQQATGKWSEPMTAEEFKKSLISPPDKE